MATQHHYSFTEFINTVFDTAQDKAGAAVSVGMITTPLWLQYLQPVSQVAALLAPILGCIYLSLQIGYKLLGKERQRS